MPPREADKIRSLQDLALYVDKYKDRIRVRDDGGAAVTLTSLPSDAAIRHALGIVRSGKVPLVDEG